jgi:LuxR family maltose regulon positive regulatory protein
MALHADGVPELHRRASAWYEEAGLLDDAMKHAVAAGNLARAARIVEAHGRSLLFRGELNTLLRWIGSLPEEEIQTSAPICISHAWALLLTGQPEPLEVRLRQVEQSVAPDNPLLGDVAAIGAYAAAKRGDIPQTLELARSALEKLPPSRLGERAVVSYVLGGAHLWEGDVRAAADAFSKATTVGQEGGNLHLALPALNSLAGIQISQGKLRQAEATAQEAIHLVAGPDGRPLPIAAGAVSALAELAYEWNRLDEALTHAQRSVTLARLWGNADPLGFAYLTLANVQIALGRLDKARETLRDASRLSEDATLFPSFYPALQAAQARLSLTEGDVAAAGQWAEEVTVALRGVTGMEEILTLAQVQLTRGRPDAALEAISGLLEVARAQELRAWLVRGLALQAVIHHAQGQKTRALPATAEALTLAAPEGYVRSFVDLGTAMAPLLREAVSQDITPDYAKDLLSALGLPEGMSGPPQPLIEPLSDRELEVLALVAEGLSNREVGRRLYIAESTVKSHLNHVYGKLAVDNRTQAAAKARALNLIG